MYVSLGLAFFCYSSPQIHVANPRFRRSHHWFVVSPAEVLPVGLGCCHDGATLQEPWEHPGGCEDQRDVFFHVHILYGGVHCSPPKNNTEIPTKKFNQPPCLVFFHESTRVCFSPRYQLRWGAVRSFLGKQILRESSFAVSEEVG